MHFCGVKMDVRESRAVLLNLSNILLFYIIIFFNPGELIDIADGFRLKSLFNGSRSLFDAVLRGVTDSRLSYNQMFFFYWFANISYILRFIFPALILFKKIIISETRS